MAWVPKYKSEGLFGPNISPCAMGSLADICDHHGTYYETYDNAGGYYESWSGADHFYTWLAMGVNFRARLESILKAAEGDGMHTGVEIAELEFIKPQGAQYYKQTLVLIGQYEAQNRVQRIGEHDGKIITLEYLPCEIGVTGYYRREYATPYSDPIATPIANVPIIAVTFNIKLAGERKLEPTTYFLESGYFCCSTYTYNSKKFLGFAFYTRNERQDWDKDPAQNASGIMSGIGDATMLELFGVDIPTEEEDPNEEDDEEGDGPGGSGGNGDHILPNYPIEIPPLPDIGIASILWLSVYEMDGPDLDTFGQDMLDARGWDALRQWFNNPLEAIVNIMLVPVAAPTNGTRTPSVGSGSAVYAWSKAFPLVKQEFVEVDCGRIEIPPYWDSAFDFDNFTKIYIFLPFIGYKPIKADECMGGSLRVVYHVDVCTGDCIAFVQRIAGVEEGFYGPMYGQVIGQYSGNCGIRVPIGRSSSDAAIDASMRLMGSAVGVGITAATGGLAGLAAPESIAASQLGAQISSATMTAVNGAKQHIERSGAIGSCAGYMGMLTPYIIREIPSQVLPRPQKTMYHKLEGYPTNYGGTLRDMNGTGYQAVEAIQLNGLLAYDSEITEIETYLKGGVIV